ncbi:MAG: 3'(2'),5'-bisphosphate nucleotidase CysQ [Steroidobacteraceae bacterium]
MSDHPLLEALIGAALEAGRAVEAIRRGGFELREKPDASPVTTADHAAEAIILDRLRRCAAGYPVVAEEEAAAGRAPGSAEEFFLVDPLDGTKEFIAGRTEYTVNIALVRGGLPVLGVVHAPALGLVYAGDTAARRAFRCASSGSADAAPASPGARETIRVRPVPEGGVVAVASRSHATPATDAYLARAQVTERISIGSSLKFCVVAEGRADLYPRLGTTMEWDTAAGHAVLLAAGGCVAAADGAALRYGKPDYRNGWFVAAGALTPLPIAA